MNKYNVYLERYIEAENEQDAILEFCNMVSQTEDEGFRVCLMKEEKRTYKDFLKKGGD